MDYPVPMDPLAPIVLTIRYEIRAPLRVLMGFWFLAALVVVVFADTLWLLAIAGAALLASLEGARRMLKPRDGDLARLVINRSKRTIYWAHHGFEAEELPFSALRALMLQPAEAGMFKALWALDHSGRRISLGNASVADMERMARELSLLFDVPLWYAEHLYSDSPEIDVVQPLLEQSTREQ